MNWRLNPLFSFGLLINELRLQICLLSSPDVIKEKGLEHVTVDDLVAEITPKGRALVPDSVKKELLQRIRTFLAQHANL
uniref:Transcription and mRNA export factor ENY2 n=1 Tax=Pavo cristatus TaxID=9049 RepID=A0A8C9FW91_PAVCR